MLVFVRAVVRVDVNVLLLDVLFAVVPTRTSRCHGKSEDVCAVRLVMVSVEVLPFTVEGLKLPGRARSQGRERQTRGAPSGPAIVPPQQSSRSRTWTRWYHRRPSVRRDGDSIHRRRGHHDQRVPSWSSLSDCWRPAPCSVNGYVPTGVVAQFVLIVNVEVPLFPPPEPVTGFRPKFTAVPAELTSGEIER